MKQLTWIVLFLTISTFSQTPGGGVTDIDGNRYNSVIIGTQEWMKENLNVSKYSDGTIIPQVTDPAAWTSLTTGAWCYYNNDPANGAIYGKLYNLYAVLGIHSAASFSDPSLRKELSPTGWRVSVNRVDADEWTILSDYLGGLSIAGGKMKEIGTSHWTSPNAGATNSSGFTALPGGYRESNGIFWEIGKYGFWWPHMWRNDFINNRSLYLGYLSSGLITSSGLGDIRMGLSIRCIKNGNLVNPSFNNNNLYNLFPNPAKDQITIDLGTNSNAISWSYKIVNTLGQEVLNGVLRSQQNIIELNNIKGQGVYFVKVYDGSNALIDTKKIIIQQ